MSKTNRKKRVILSEQNILHLLFLCKSGVSNSAIAQRLNVGEGAVSKIICGRTRTEITGFTPGEMSVHKLQNSKAIVITKDANGIFTMKQKKVAKQVPAPAPAPATTSNESFIQISDDVVQSKNINIDISVSINGTRISADEAKMLFRIIN